MATKKKAEPKAATAKRAPATKPRSATATQPQAEAAPPTAPLNREQRRRQKFGKAGNVHQHDPIGPWPQVEANPALNAAGDQAAQARRPDQDVTQATGPGSGGATEEAEPRPEHEDAHPGNSTKG